MKGIFLMSKMFLIFTTLAMTIILTTIIWLLIVTHEIESRLFVTSPRNVELSLFIRPSKYETTLLSFLELEKDGIPMKKLIEAVAIQNSTDIWIDGKSINVRAAADGYLQNIIDTDYLLKISYPDEPEIKISEVQLSTSSQVPLQAFKTSTELFLPDGKIAYLKFFVKG